MEQKLAPAVTELSTVSDANAVLESGKTVVVALFDELKVSLRFASPKIFCGFICWDKLIYKSIIYNLWFRVLK